MKFLKNPRKYLQFLSRPKYLANTSWLQYSLAVAYCLFFSDSLGVWALSAEAAPGLETPAMRHCKLALYSLSGASRALQYPRAPGYLALRARDVYYCSVGWCM